MKIQMIEMPTFDIKQNKTNQKIDGLISGNLNVSEQFLLIWMWQMIIIILPLTTYEK